MALDRFVGFSYCAFFCEENIWHLCADGRVQGDERYVLMISNPGNHVALWGQRASEPEEPVIWDYHVILLALAPDGPQVWDFDSRLGFPSPAKAYFHHTFRETADPLRPVFRRVKAEDYRARLNTDRRHMTSDSGELLQPAPAWPPIGQGHNLPSFLDMEDEAFAGDVLELPALLATLD